MRRYCRAPIWPLSAGLQRGSILRSATVLSETSKPSLSSSPWIFGAPQPEFSQAIVRIRVRSSGVTFGRRPEGRERQRQYSWKPALCQPTTVSGFTITRTSDHRGHRFRKAVQKKRSRQFSVGRGRLRLRTATCWPKARTSSAVSIRLRTKTRPATTSANIKSNMKQPLYHHVRVLPRTACANHKCLISIRQKVLTTHNRQL
jgi:hypothetical protein